MAQIELRDVSRAFSSVLKDHFSIIPSISKRRMPEDQATKTSRGLMALDHVNLDVPDGQTFVIIGPSGCGKTTLLRIIAGLDDEYTGQVFYDGTAMESIPAKKRGIGMVFQNYALYPNFEGEGNLSFFFRMHNISDEKTKERIQYTSDLMGIGFDELLSRRPGNLSGGQKQRLAIGRAIVRNPRLFLFDEPLSSLDAQLRAQTRVEIKRLLHRFDITSLYVTHDQTEAIALADQIVIMRSGKVEQVGAYQDLMDHPANLFVAGFLGSSPMNMLPGGRVSTGELVLDEVRIPLPERVLAAVQDDQPLVLGMRPEAISVAGRLDRPDTVQLQGEVEMVEPDFTHHTQLVQLQTGSLSYSGLCSLDVELNLGDSVPVQFDIEQMYFFDQASGASL